MQLWPGTVVKSQHIFSNWAKFLPIREVSLLAVALTFVDISVALTVPIAKQPPAALGGGVSAPIPSPLLC